MIEKPVYIITLDSANYSMYLYKLLKEQSIKIYMIQPPCCLSAGCARSIEVSEDKIDNVIEIIKDKNKIVSVHSRKAEKEVFELLQEYRIKNAIFHWYSGPLSLIEEIINAGYYFSINEAMTTSISGRKIISKIPLNRILTETDAPLNKHSNILNAISNIGLTEDVIYSNFLNLINAIV